MASFLTIHAVQGCRREGLFVLAAVTRSPGEMVIEDVSVPGRARAGHVIVRPERVGICGSDLHLFSGDVGALSGARDFYPRVQGHEVSAVVEDAGDTRDVNEGDRVAIWPVLPCGRCYSCRSNRPNACTRFRLVGVHLDGGLAERLEVPAGLVFGVGDLDPDSACFVEPASVAVHALARGRLTAGEQVVVFGAGPIGLATLVAAVSQGAAGDFRTAISLVAASVVANRMAVANVFSHHFPLARTAEAFEFAMSRPPDAIKIVVTVP